MIPYSPYMESDFLNPEYIETDMPFVSQQKTFLISHDNYMIKSIITSIYLSRLEYIQIIKEAIMSIIESHQI